MTKADPPSAANPYPGLRPFEQDDTLYGRDRQVDELIRILKAERFVVVTGVSGSGKSSLVRAGLVPALIHGLLPIDQINWKIAIMTPGVGPIMGLRAALAKVQIFEAGTRLENCGTALVEAVKAAAEAVGGSSFAIFLFVDQFEDLFRYAMETDADEASAFIELLGEATRQRAAPIYVVLTVRSDFLGEAARFRELPELLNRSNYLIARMTRAELTEAITRPANIAGATLGGRLVERMLNDTGDDPSRLPLLQHALNRTWEHWTETGSQGDLEVTHYREAGTIDGEDGKPGALHVHAQCIYEKELSDSQRAIAEALFRCITERTTQGRDCRRPCVLETVARVAFAPGDADARWRSNDEQRGELHAVAAVFRRYSFLRTREAGSAAELIDLSHESLIWGWGTLRAWLEDEARRVKDWTWLVETERRSGGEDNLLRASQIKTARALVNSKPFNRFWAETCAQTKDAATFDRVLALIAKSEVEAKKQLVEAQASQVKAQAQERERRRNRKIIFFLVLAVAVILAIVTVILVHDRADKERILGEKNDALQKQKKAFEKQGVLLTENKVLLEQAKRNATKEKERADAETKRAESARKQSRAATLDAHEKYNTAQARELVLALRETALALHLDPGNRRAITDACDLLTRYHWCVPASGAFHAPAMHMPGGTFVAAAFNPSGQVVAVGRDGRLYVEGEGNMMKAAQSLLPTVPPSRGPVPNIDPKFLVNRDAPPDASSQEKTASQNQADSSLSNVSQNVDPGERGARPSPPLPSGPALYGASFSDDGRWLVVFHATPNNSKKLPTCQVWKWTDQAYTECGSALEFKERSSYRNIVWSGDGKSFAVGRWNEPLSQIFRFDGTDYDSASAPQAAFIKEEPAAVGFSADSKFLATATLVGKPLHQITVRLWETNGLKPLGPASGLKPVLTQPWEAKPTQILFGPGKDELTIGTLGSPPLTLNLRKDAPPGGPILHNFGSTMSSDPVIRLAFDSRSDTDPHDEKPPPHHFLAATMNNRVELFTDANLERRALEAICPRGFIGMFAFGPKGDRILTLTGGSWGSFDTIRVWDLTMRPKIEFDTTHLPANDIAPPWLADLADVVGGNEDESENGGGAFAANGAPIHNLSDLRKRYSDDQIRGKYEAIWDRYFPKPGSHP